jgi:hypothetical protein
MMMICEPPKTEIVYPVLASENKLSCHYEFSVAGLEGSIMFGIQIGPDILSDDMVEYLNDRARQDGISFEEAYREEMDARATANREAFDIDELQALAGCSAAKPQLVDDDEECPF